ncbi:deaminase [Legionella sp. D16C41]|uniref:deaminase n=1 Tax=Legionella sp. D16C41 TaxID=3402688 RepID=UPI003AF708A8
MHELIAYTRTNNSTAPYGCSIYSEDGELLASACGNHLSPINHAEILAIDACAKKYPNIKWNTLTLYTTGEPCCMCAAACCWANLKEVVYATGIPLMLELWGVESELRAEFIINNHPKKPNLIIGICEEESNLMFKEYKNRFAAALNKYRWPLQSKRA